MGPMAAHKNVSLCHDLQGMEEEKCWHTAKFPIFIAPALKWEHCCNVQEDGERGAC